VGVKSGGKQSAKGREAEERRERLAAALRDNLARRKAQARARAEKHGETRQQDDTAEPGRDGDG